MLTSAIKIQKSVCCSFPESKIWLIKSLKTGCFSALYYVLYIVLNFFSSITPLRKRGCKGTTF